MRSTARKAIGVLAPAVVLVLSAVSAFADDPCHRRICRGGYHYRHGRCESDPAPITGARSHYRIDQPVCQAGWQVDGDDCVKIECCWRRACASDERYRDGYCHRGPTFFGYRSHHRASCPVGWDLQLGSGLCRQRGCEGQPPPPAVAAGSEDARTPGPGDPPPPVVGEVRINSIEASPCIDRGGFVRIRGEGFGPVQAGRRLVLGGHGISVRLDVRRWSDGLIEAVIPDDPRIDRGQWYYIGVQSGDGNWISNIDKTFTVCGQLQ